MNNNRGIFENLPNKPSSSPFSVVHEPAAAAPSPFAPASRQNSPFAAKEEAQKAAKIPERRKTDSPFQVADAHEGFGFEAAPPTSPFAAAPSFASAPFEPSPAASPFAAAPAEPVARTTAPSPFSPEPGPVPSAQTWPPLASPPQVPAPQAPSYPSAFNPVAAPPAQAPAPSLAPVSQPQRPVAQAPQQAAAPIRQHPPTPVPPFARHSDQDSDSFSIRQLELRAIFGVDREMGPEEIMQRARSLPGIRHIARVNAQDVAAVDAMKQVIANLGFGSGGIKLYAGSIPVEFIRETGILLAVQTDGGFAPGVRETLMIVARELGRA